MGPVCGFQIRNVFQGFNCIPSCMVRIDQGYHGIVIQWNLYDRMLQMGEAGGGLIQPCYLYIDYGGKANWWGRSASPC